MLVVVHLHVERAFEALFGLSAGASSTWAVVILPLLLSPLIALALCKATIGFKGLGAPRPDAPRDAFAAEVRALSLRAAARPLLSLKRLSAL